MDINECTNLDFARAPSFDAHHEIPTVLGHESYEEVCTQHDYAATQTCEESELSQSVPVTANEPWARLVSSHKAGLQLDLTECPPDSQGRCVSLAADSTLTSLASCCD